MKKIVLTIAMMVSAAMMAGDFSWSWWTTAPDNSAKTIRGCALGIASQFKQVSGAQVSLIMNKSERQTSGAQVAIGYNRTDKLTNGCQCAVVNSADTAALQLGLICVNKNGFLPVFVFFNFCPSAFGGNN